MDKLAAKQRTTRGKKKCYNLKKKPATVSFRTNHREDAWTRNEKEKLLDAIHKHGIENIEQLQAAVPGRTTTEIKNYLITCKNESAWTSMKNISPPLEQWLDVLNLKDMHGHLTPDSSREISRFLEFIANTECHPPPEMCNGVDFKEMYLFLSQILSGKHPRQVSSPSAVALREIGRFFSELLKSKNISNHSQFLRKINVSGGKAVPVTKSYGTKRDVPLMDVWGDADINPLKVFTDMLELDPSDLQHWDNNCFQSSGLKDSDVMHLIKGHDGQAVNKMTYSQNPVAGTSQLESNDQNRDYDIQQELNAIVAEVEASCAQAQLQS